MAAHYQQSRAKRRAIALLCLAGAAAMIVATVAASGAGMLRCRRSGHQAAAVSAAFVLSAAVASIGFSIGGRCAVARLWDVGVRVSTRRHALSEADSQQSCDELVVDLTRYAEELRSLDDAHGAGVSFYQKGMTAAKRALKAAILDAHRHAERAQLEECADDATAPQGTSLHPIWKARCDRTSPAGRTCKTGEEHLALLNELRPYKVLLLGDSHFERFPRRGHGADYFAMLECHVGRIFAASVGGDSVEHLDWRLREQRLLDHFTEPLQAVIVMIGSNDLLCHEGPFRGQPTVVAERLHDLLLMVTRHPVAVDATLYVLAIPPTLHDSATSERGAARLKYNAWLQNSVSGLGARFLDCFAGHERDPSIFKTDGVHLSPEGYKHLVESLYAAMCDNDAEAASCSTGLGFPSI